MGCFFFNDTATTEIYTLSLHDALPISVVRPVVVLDRREDHAQWGSSTGVVEERALAPVGLDAECRDRKSTRLNSSHANISYAVFCLKKIKHISERINENDTSVISADLF